MKFKYNIMGLDCPNCAAKLARIIEENDGIARAKINFLTEKLTIESELDGDAVLTIATSAAKAFDKAVKIEK